MRSRCSLYVDVGYLLASAATRVTGTSLRHAIHVEFRSLVTALIAEAEQRSGLPVLRVHWYDSARNGVPDTQQERIGELSKVKLRLGRFGVDGQQKGVDLRIGLDLVAHARNGAAEVFFLVSGDDDLTEAVEEAQVHGVQVVVLAVPNAAGSPHAVSRHLLRAADELAVLSPESIDSTVMRVEVPRTPEPVPADERPPGESAPAPAAATRSRIPTPLEVAAKARAVAGSAASAASGAAGATTVPPAAVLVYQGSTGGSSHVLPGYVEPEDHDEQIDAVVAKVLTAFRQSASPEDLELLVRGKPSIPRDVDRALLQDMSDALDVYDLNDGIRYRLRERFWEQFG